jgi:hypothetical protein
MNSQYLYLFPLCFKIQFKFKHVFFDEEARHLDRFPIIIKDTYLVAHKDKIRILMFPVLKSLHVGSRMNSPYAQA